MPRFLLASVVLVPSGHIHFSVLSAAKKGEYELAIQDYNRVIDLDPCNTHAFHNRGISYDKLTLYDKAIQDFTRVLELDPDNANAYFNRGSAFDSLGDFDRAIADYTKALDLDMQASAQQQQQQLQTPQQAPRQQSGEESSSRSASTVTFSSKVHPSLCFDLDAFGAVCLCVGECASCGSLRFGCLGLAAPNTIVWAVWSPTIL